MSKNFARIDQSSDFPRFCMLTNPRTYGSDTQESQVVETDCLARLSCDIYHDLAQFSACNGSLLQCNVINSLFIMELSSNGSTTVLDLKHELQQKLHLNAQEPCP